MVRSTLRRLKDEKKLLIRYANLLGIEGDSWESIAPYLVISQDAISERSDGSNVFVVPEVCLRTDASAEKSRRLALALLQPGTRYASDRVFFAPDFTSLVENWQSTNTNGTPVITKGVSYPSSLQRGKSQGIIGADNVWLLDLFTGGCEYCRQMGDPNAYRIVDTTIYEGWNRFSDEQMRRILIDLPSSNPGGAIVERFLDTVRRPEFEYLLENTRRRGAYLQAIANVLGLPEVVKMEDVIASKQFQQALTQVAEAIDPTEAFSFEGGTNARDFTPFVYAEELALRDLIGAASCTGPVREDLPLNVGVLKLYRKTGQNPTPITWYTRPGEFPQLNFSDGKSKVREVISSSQNEYLPAFLQENLVRGSRMEARTELYTVSQLTSSLHELMRQVQKTYQQLR